MNESDFSKSMHETVRAQRIQSLKQWLLRIIAIRREQDQLHKELQQILNKTGDCPQTGVELDDVERRLSLLIFQAENGVI